MDLFKAFPIQPGAGAEGVGSSSPVLCLLLWFKSAEDMFPGRVCSSQPGRDLMNNSKESPSFQRVRKKVADKTPQMNGLKE